MPAKTNAVINFPMKNLTWEITVFNMLCLLDSDDIVMKQFLQNRKKYLEKRINDNTNK